MSRGISIYYKLLVDDENKLVYGYSGADINQIYDEKLLLNYDGLIEISKNAFQFQNASEALENGEIIVKKECTYENHHKRLLSGQKEVGFFAVKVILKVFREFEELKNFQKNGAIVY